MENQFDKEQIYDEQISPLMKQIIAICKENNIHMLCDFFIGNTEDKPDFHATSYLESPDNNSVNTENAAKLIRLMITKEDRDNSVLIAALLHAVSYAYIDMDSSDTRFKKYTEFKVDDWVIESTSQTVRPPILATFGKVLEITGEGLRKKVLIQKINGHTIEWGNCRFLKIPGSEFLDSYNTDGGPV